MVLEQLILLLQDFFSNHRCILCAWIHGSQAKNSARHDSDLDIAVASFSGGLSAEQKLDISQRLNILCSIPVHLGIVQSSNLVFNTEVFQHGKLIYCADKTKTDFLIMRLLSMYASFNEERKTILDAYRR